MMKIAIRILLCFLVSALAAPGIAPSAGSPISAQQTAGELFEKALYVEEGQGDLQKAIGLYRDIVKRFPENRPIAAKALLHIGFCYEKLGVREAEKAFQRVIAEYPEQFEHVKAAREKLSAILKARSSPSPAPLEPNIRLIASGPEAQGESRVSPDGMSLSFIEGDPRSLCVKELVSGKKVVVVTGSYSGKAVEGPVNSRWSPDGKKLAFGWFNADNSIELRTAGTDGSDVRTLYRQKNEMVFPMAWSPDGKSIAVSFVKDFYTSYSVALISAGDGTVTILKTVKMLKTAPKAMAFSGDGRFVVVDLPQKDDDPKHDLFAFPVDGGHEVRVVSHPADDALLGGRPGSDDLLFSSDRTGTLDAWVVRFAEGKTTGEPRLVRKGLGQVTPLGVGREGSLYYSLDTEMVDIYVASIDLEKRALIGPPAALALPLVGVNYDPQWSPDGASLAFVADRKGGPGARTTQALWLRDDRTGESHEIVTKLLSFGRPRWSPDGRSLYVVGSDAKTSLALLRVDVKTGEATFLVDSEPGTNIKFIAPARDGKSVYYTYFEFAKKQCRVMSIDVSTRETHELYRQPAPPDVGRLSVSPDGRQLVFGTLVPETPGASMDDSPLVMKAIPLPGGAPQDLVKTKVKLLGATCWTPDAKGLLLFKDVSEGKIRRSELSFLPAAGGELQSLGLTLDGSPSAASLHPDGRRLAYSVRKPGAEIWVMENFLAAEKKIGQGHQVTKVYENDGRATGFFSPDGKKLALAGPDLRVRDLETGQESVLAKTPHGAYWCLWSPDMDKIAFMDGMDNLYVVPAKGGPQVPIILKDSDFRKSGHYAWPTGWTSDGTMLVCEVSPRKGLIAIPVAGGEWKQLYTPKDVPPGAESEAMKTLSPNGKLIAYYSKRSGNNEIYVMPAGGGPSIQITDNPGSDTGPSWSPDGKFLAFLSTRTGTQQPWAVAVTPDGRPEGEPVQVFRGEVTPNDALSWIAGNRIGLSLSILATNLFVSDLATGRETQLTNMLRADRSPSWSPDGKTLAYVTGSGGKDEIWLVPAEGGEPRPVTFHAPFSSDGRFIFRPSWLPDGTKLLFGGFMGIGNRGLWLIPTEGGNPRKMEFGFDWQLGIGDLSPDGSEVAFDYTAGGEGNFIKGSRVGQYDIYIIPFKGGEPRRITTAAKDGLSFRMPRWSPDGKRIAFAAFDEKAQGEGKPGMTIWVCDVLGGEPHPIGVEAGALFLCWSREGKSIIFSNASGLCSVGADGGEVRKLNIRGFSPDISPDGKKIAYVRKGQGKEECLIVENFLPSERR